MGYVRLGKLGLWLIYVLVLVIWLGLVIPFRILDVNAAPAMTEIQAHARMVAVYKEAGSTLVIHAGSQPPRRCLAMMTKLAPIELGCGLTWEAAFSDLMRHYPDAPFKDLQ